MLAEDIDGEFGVGDKTCEVLGEVCGDFKLISEGDVFFLKFLIAGELHGDMWGERKFEQTDALEELGRENSSSGWEFVLDRLLSASLELL